MDGIPQTGHSFYILVHLLTLNLIKEIAALSIHPKKQSVLHSVIFEGNDIPGTVEPNIGVKHELDLKKYPNARCLDGTPGAYYINRTLSPLSMNKFYIFKMGGDVCFTYESCLDRSNSFLGSSSSEYGWKPQMNLVGAAEVMASHAGFNRDPVNNPLLWDWNH